MVINPDTALLAQEAFALAAAGKSLRQIIAALTPKGLANRKGEVMTPTSVRAILTNPFYCGLIRVQGGTVPGHHTALIAKEQFELAQRKIAGRRKSNRAGK